jgi:prepilin-type N-terminal cleavage/methylation domain-containing protein/prepilin-type processing-associated H-X9-DG protein
MVSSLRRAFTLLELMIVVVIIAVLVALLVPSFSQAWGVANETRCADNLHCLWHAIAMRNADQIGPSWRPTIRPTIWPSQLLPYIERGAEFMICPVGGESTSGDGSGGSGGGSGGSGGGYDDGGSGPPAGGSSNPPKYAQLSDLAEVKVIASSGTYFTALEEGRWVLKLSDEQYNAAKAMNLLGNSDDANFIRDKFNCSYHAGSNRDAYWLCVEDHGADEDYKDVMVRVTEQSDGSFVLDVCAGSTGHTNSIVSKPDGAELLKVPSGAQGLHIAVKPTDDEMPGPGDPGGGGSLPGTASSSWDIETTPTVVVSTSYAMNANYHKLAGRAGKILLMDYTRYLAYVTDNWRDEKMDPRNQGTPIFARHWGRANVLYTDGSVCLEDPKDLDPAIPSIERRLWDP